MDQNNNGHRENSQRQGAPINSHDTGMSFLIKKGEKLTTALYMVSDIMPEKEPMKWKIRETGVELLSDLAVSYGGSASERMSVMGNVIKKIEKIVSFLEITERAHMISEMNASVLKKEYLNLKDAIEKEWNNIYDKSKSVFSESFFEVPREVKELKPAPEVPSVPVAKEIYAQPSNNRQPERQVYTPQPAPRPQYQAPQNHANTRTPQNVVPKMEARVEEGGMRHPQFPTQQIVRPTPQVIPPPAPRMPAPIPREMPLRTPQGERGSNDRRTIILNKIKEKPSINVRDLADSIPNVSEKTIQRELLAMVAEGLLVKKGERRWSTYSLKV